MMRARTRRLGIVGISAALLVVAGILVVLAVRDSADLFWTPTKLAEIGGPTPGLSGKVGGFVAVGSLSYSSPTEISFSVIDDAHSISVIYEGIAPDLFEEGAGVVAEGSFNEVGVFVARQLLAKHDENYVPRELSDVEGPSS
ncbi:MAG: cytochrome c maturation protein CcmE [Pseudomonadota bacterium]